MTSAEVVIYNIDPGHSQVGFKIRHFFNKVPGSFSDFTGEIHVDKSDMSKSKVKATIKPASIDTGNTDRDEHLLEDDYFDTAKFTTIEFESTEWVPTGENTYDVKGNLTMLGVTKPVVLKTTYLGEQEGVGPYEGLMVNGWEATTTLDRTEFGMESGVILGDEVDVELSIQGHAKK
ncbi:MAG: YceI family protein [Verrucomicrobiota bacterium]